MILLRGAPKLPSERAQNKFALEYKLAKALGGLLMQTRGLITVRKGCICLSREQEDFSPEIGPGIIDLAYREIDS